MQTIALATPIQAPQAVAWKVMTNHSLYACWTPSSQMQLEVQGTPEPNGVGAVRVFYVGPTKTREEITTFEPPARMSYRILSTPLPIRNCHSDLLLVPSENEKTCTLHWDSWFELIMPFSGTIMRRIVTTQIKKISNGIAAEAALQADGS